METKFTYFGKKSIIMVSLIFIFIYFHFINTIYTFPNNFQIPLISLIGFTVIIIIVFYFFINILINNEENKFILNFRFFNEFTLKFLLLVSILISLLIPPISTTRIITDWNQLTFLNYFRAIIILLGISIIPGASLYNIFFPNSNLHEKLNIEPIILKITIFPVISFTFLGIMTLILDFFGLMRENFLYPLIFVIILLFSVDFFIQKYRYKKDINLKLIKLNFSKFSILIIFIIIGIIFIAFDIQISVKYLTEGDSYKAISISNYIGVPSQNPYDMFSTSGAYWGYISFSLSVLTGIPAINVNVMLFPFLYLFVTSLYIFMKALLSDFKEIYPLLSTILVIIFSGLFFISEPISGRNVSYWIIYDAILNFRYKSFALILLLLSLSFFMCNIRISKNNTNSLKIGKKDLKLSLIGSWFLLQSTLIYFIPIIIAITFMIIFSLINDKKVENYRSLILYLTFFIIMFIPIDMISRFFFSWVPSTFLAYYLGIPEPDIHSQLNINALIFYSIFIGFILINYLFYKLFARKLTNRFRKYYKLKSKIIFIIFLSFLTILLGYEIVFNFILKIDQAFFTFYLDAIFLNIGFIGILGLYLSYFCFKTNRKIFHIIIIWIFITILEASLLIFYRWIQNPFTLIANLNYDDYYYMIYLFYRIWGYSIFPFSILTSIGIIKLKNEINSKRNTRKTKNVKKSKKLILSTIIPSIFIFMSFSSSIISGIYWYNIDYKLDDDQAEVIGWVEENLPKKSNILVDRYNFRDSLDKIAHSFPFLINFEVRSAIDQYLYGEAIYEYDQNCYLNFIDNLDNHSNVLEIKDFNNEGSVLYQYIFKVSQMNGTMEFFLRTTKSTNDFHINFKDDYGNLGFGLSIDSSSLYVNNESKSFNISYVDNDEWYQFKINFECSDGEYLGLNRYQWSINIEGIDYGEFQFKNKINQFQNIEFNTNNIDMNWSIFIDDFKVNWLPEVLDCLYTTPIIIDHLNQKDIRYLIHSKESNYAIIRADQLCVDINEELIKKYFLIKIYEYGNFEVYRSV